MNPLALDLVHGRDKATRFFDSDPRNRDGSPYRESLAEALRESNLEWGNDVGADIEAWSGGDAVAVIAGQQVGFGGGPLYTLVKIASLVHLKRSLEREGRKVAVFFWMATEDHDFDEVARLSLEIDGRLREFRSHGDPAERLPVGALPVPDDLRNAILKQTSLRAEGWLAPDLSLRDSFARLLAGVTHGEVILVDSLMPELREAGRDLFSRIGTEFDMIQSAIASRSNELSRAGYRAQIQSANGDRYTLMYELDEGGARRQVDSGKRLAMLAETNPRVISTAALMRPLLQDTVFAPEVFVGGPAEVAYYAQLGTAYQILGVHQPRVALRSHCLVVPEKLIRGLARHGVEKEEWLDPVEEIISRRERDRELRLAARIEALKKHFDAELDEIRASILEVDPSLTRSLNRTSRRIDHHLGVLERRGRRVIARNDQERFEAIERFANAIRPGGVVQDRIVGWLSYWLRWGDRLLDSLVPHAEPGSDELKIIGIS